MGGAIPAPCRRQSLRRKARPAMTIIGSRSPGLNGILIRPEELLLLTYNRTAPLIRGIAGILLPVLALFSFSCGPPRPTPVARGAEPPAPLAPPSPAQLVWNNRSRDWDRLLVGLTHLPDRSPLTAKPAGAGKLFEVPSGKLLGRVRAGAPVMLSAGPGETVQFVTTGVSGAARALRLETGAAGFRLEGHRHAGALLCWRAGERVA